MRQRIAKTALSAALACAPLLARAADAAGAGTDKLKSFGLARSDAGSLPIGRVLVTFVLVAALAWAATWLLRRYGYRGAASAAGGGTGIRAVARNSLPGGVTCHVVEAQGRQVLITVTRQGVAAVVLGETPLAPADPAPSPPAALPGASA